MSIFDKFQNTEIENAQNRLDDLCRHHGIKPFKIKYSGPESKKWQALVLRICGLQVDDPNRGPKESEDTYNVGSHAYTLLDFWEIDENTGKKITKEDIYKEVIREQDLKPKDMPKGRKTNPRNTVKKALETVMDKRKKPPED
jgi:hypothetical protein